MATSVHTETIRVDEATGRRTIAMNLGPQHPATHGTLRVKLELDGENVVSAEPEIGFLHTGFEKLLGRRADRKRKLYNGRIECAYYQFHGPRPHEREYRISNKE